MSGTEFQSMDLTSLKAVVSELRREILPSRFEKAQQPESNCLQIGLRTLKGLKWIEISWDVEVPRFVEISPPPKSGSSSTLAKQIQHGLNNLALVEIKQEGYERIVQLGLANRPNEPLQKLLVIELMGKHSNIFLLDKNNKIITLGRQIRSHQSKLRPLSTGDYYFDPPKLNGIPPNKNESFLDWKKRLTLVPISLKKAIQQNYQGISPSLTMQLANERNEIAKEIINLNVNQISNEQFMEIYSRWITWIQDIEKESLFIKFEGPTDFKLWGSENSTNESKTGTSIKLGIYYRNHIIKRNINHLRKSLEQCLNKLKVDEERDLEKQKVLLSKTYEHKSIQKEADKIFCLRSPNKQQIEEAQKLYRKSKKLKRSGSIIEDRIYHHQQKLEIVDASINFLNDSLKNNLGNESDMLNRLIDLRNELDIYLIKTRNNKKKSKTLKESISQPLEVKTSDGSLVLIGQNHRQNELISIKQVRKGDIWFHAQECSGSHIILKASLQTATDKDFELAADLAALFSKAKGNKIVAVVMAPAHKLQRIQSAVPGTVRHQNGEVVWGKPERASKHLSKN